jgi:hypothetical protein
MVRRLTAELRIVSYADGMLQCVARTSKGRSAAGSVYVAGTSG